MSSTTTRDSPLSNPIRPSFWSSSSTSSSHPIPPPPTLPTAALASPSSTTATATSPTDGPFRSLIAQKERELHDINEYRLKSLEEAVRNREASEQAIRTKFKKLKEDFIFNLRLIEERDRELDKYESTCDKLKTYVREREKDLASLKIDCTEYKTKLIRKEEEASKMEVTFQHQLKTMASQMEASKWESEQIVQDYETKVHSLSVRVEETLRERTSALASQEDVFKQEVRRMSETNDSRNQAKDSTHKRIVGELNQRITELQQELVNNQDKVNQTMHDKDQLLEKKLNYEAKIKKLEWTLSDVQLTKDREIQSLTKEKNELKTMKQTLLDEYENKMGELLQSLHAVEGAFVQQREQYELQLRQEASTREDELRRMSLRLQTQLTNAEEQLNEGNRARLELKNQMTSMKNADQENLMEMKREVEEYKITMNHLTTTTNNNVREMEGRLFSMDMEMKSAKENADRARENEEKLKSEVRVLKSECKRCLERESQMKKEHSDTSIGWQTRWERDRKDLQQRHDQMVSVLQQQRDHMETENRILDTKVSDLESDASALRIELNNTKTELRNNLVVSTNLQHELQKERAKSTRTAIRGVTRSNEDTTPDDTPENTLHSPRSPRSPRSSTPTLPMVAARTSVDSLDSDELGPIASPLRPLDPKTFDAIQAPSSPSTSIRSSIDSSIGGGRRKPEQPEQQQEQLSRALVVENQKLRAAVAIMAREMEEVQHQQSSGGRGSSEGGGDMLKSQLNQAETDVQQLRNEKERLMEVSNQLRADINHASSMEERKIKLMASQVEQETSKKYQYKMSKIERKLNDLVLHNQALTSELSKWTLDTSGQEDAFDLDVMGLSSDGGLKGSSSSGDGGGGGGSGDNGDRRGRGDRGDRGRGNGIVDSIDLDLLRSFDNGLSFDADVDGEEGEEGEESERRKYDDEEEDVLDEGDLLFYGRKSKTRAVIDPPSEDDTSEDDEEDGSGVGFEEEGQLSQLKHKLRQRLNGSRAAAGGGAVGAQDKRTKTEGRRTKEPKDNRGGKTTARERLRQVRESLELVATKPILHPQASKISASNRATKSQKQQRSKMRGGNERRKVRKYKPGKVTGMV